MILLTCRFMLCSSTVMRLSTRWIKLVLAVVVLVPVLLFLVHLDIGADPARQVTGSRVGFKHSWKAKPKFPKDIHSRWRRHVEEQCEQMGYSRSMRKEITPQMVKKFIYSDKHKVIYCPIPKVASTTWRRIMLLLTGKMNTTDPMALRSPDVHGKYDPYLSYLGDLPMEKIRYRLRNYFKFVIVREPFERIVSAFRNKFETNTTSSEHFRKIFGRKIIASYRENPSKRAVETGVGLKFDEFVLYLTDTKRKVPLNEHWDSFQHLCHPCLVNYDFIGKLPSIEEDSKYILNKLHVGNTVKVPSRSESKYAKKGADFYMESYYAHIPQSYLRKLYNFFRADFVIFNYTLPEIIRPLLSNNWSVRNIRDANYR